MIIIDINEARKNKHWKDEIKGGPIVFQTRKIISNIEIKNFSDDPRNHERMVKDYMVHEIAKFLVDNDVGLFTKTQTEYGVQCDMRLNVLIGQQTLERLK